MTTRKMIAGLLVLAGAMGVPEAARACGGCFSPPATVQVVTDHRMVLSLSQSRTVLWDQFRYTGAPEDFSWILPIPAGDDVVPEEADNLFLTAMDDVTGPILTTPTPPPSTCSGGGGLFGGGDYASAAGSPAPRENDVTVYDQRVVGPYEVTRLGSRNGMALTDWLRSNGYSVPPPVVPVIDHYVSLSMDFLAVRLRPNTDVSQMKPLRITMPGYVPTLPLRMIAAGVADRVGLVLTVLSESRMEAMNFPNAEVREADLRYDFDAPTAPAPDFLAAFNAVNRANGGRAWITESAFTLDQATVDQAMSQRCQFSGQQPCFDTRITVPDTRVAFGPFGGGAYVTRLRADLPASALGQDLVLAASDRGRRARNYTYGAVANTPPDPCGPTGFKGCATTPGAAGTSAAGLALAAALAGVCARRRRRA